MPIVPPSFNQIQQASIQFNNPVSESSLDAMGGAINGLLSIFLPVGTIIPTMLTEAQFQAQLGNPSPATFVLADGRSVAGSTYQSLTGNANIPDLRGISLRGKNNGRADGHQNPDGDLTLGTFTTSRNLSHAHGVTDPSHFHTFSIGKNGSDNQVFAPPYGSANGVSGSYNTNGNFTGISIQNSGGGDAAPSNVTVNYVIRIN